VLSATTVIPGNITLHNGRLRMSTAMPNTFVVGGDITISNVAISNSTPTPLLEVTYTGASTTHDTPVSLLEGVTITPGSLMYFRGGIAITGAADIRGADIFDNANGSFIGESRLFFRGSYQDDARTVIHSRSSNYVNTTRFQSGKLTDVHASFVYVPAFSAELNTTVNFYGTLSPARSAASVVILAAATDGTIRMMPVATIDAANGWSGNTYDSDVVEFHGDSSGTIEFAEGFQLMQVGGTNHLADVGASKIEFDDPITFVTNHSDNLPNFSSNVMSKLPPNVYPGEINMRADGARWVVQSHPQNYNQKIDFAADTRIITNAPLTFTADSAVGMGDKDNISLSSSVSGLRAGTRSGSLEKLGAADLAILGRLYVANYTRVIVSEGRLLLSNKSYEGYGQMDVEVRSGATLGGGSVDGL
jgi:hypothetical protein